MPQVTIRIYQNEGSAGRAERTLVRTKYIDTKSDKGLTGKSAALIIKREFPEFVLAGRVFVIKSEGILP